MDLRSPDSACNPYLALAVSMSAGLDGMKQGLTPPAPISDNIYELNEEQRISRNIMSLPGNLGEALQVFQQDELIRKTLGEHVFNRFLAAKKQEWDLYSQQVHDWELQRYIWVF
jgi:glutamine synthetase